MTKYVRLQSYLICVLRTEILVKTLLNAFVGDKTALFFDILVCFGKNLKDYTMRIVVIRNISNFPNYPYRKVKLI